MNAGRRQTTPEEQAAMGAILEQLRKIDANVGIGILANLLVAGCFGLRMPRRILFEIIKQVWTTMADERRRSTPAAPVEADG